MKADSRERILQSGIREFAEHGLAGARIDRIADLAEVNKAMIYYHFKSKEGLYKECVKELFMKISRLVMEHSANSASAEQELVSFYNDLKDFVDRMDPNLRIMLFREMSSNDGAVDLETLNEVKRTSFMEIEKLYDRTKAAGFVRKDVNPFTAHLMVVSTMAMVNSIYHQFRNSEADFALISGGYSIAEVSDQVMEIFKHGVCAMPQPCQTGEERKPTS